jgi:hypothetical protein
LGEEAVTSKGSGVGEHRVSMREWRSLRSAADQLRRSLGALPPSQTPWIYPDETSGGWKKFLCGLDAIVDYAKLRERGKLPPPPTFNEAKAALENQIGFLLAAYGLKLTTYPGGILARVLTEVYRALGHKRVDDPDPGRAMKRLKAMWTTEAVEREIPQYLGVMRGRKANVQIVRKERALLRLL